MHIIVIEMDKSWTERENIARSLLYYRGFVPVNASTLYGYDGSAADAVAQGYFHEFATLFSRVFRQSELWISTVWPLAAVSRLGVVDDEEVAD